MDVMDAVIRLKRQKMDKLDNMEVLLKFAYKFSMIKQSIVVIFDSINHKLDNDKINKEIFLYVLNSLTLEEQLLLINLLSNHKEIKK